MILKEWRAQDSWSGFVVICEFKIGERRGLACGEISQEAWKSSDRYALLRNLVKSVDFNADVFIRENI